jgi:hypothetical protein
MVIIIIIIIIEQNSNINNKVETIVVNNYGLQGTT